MFYSTLYLPFFILVVNADFYGGHIGPLGHGLGHYGKFGAGLGGIGFGFGGPKFFGGSHIDSEHFDGGKKIINDEQFHKASGKEDAALSHGEAGYTKGEEILKDIKGDSGYFYDADGGKKEYHDGGDWYGAKHHGQEGKAGGEKTVKQGHKKGHTIKGFSTSHHKDEHGKTEQFYDEEHDEGGNEEFDGHSGSFGENEKKAYKGQHIDGKFSAGDAKKGTHYEHELVDGKVHSNYGHFGENKNAGQGEVHGGEKVYGIGDVSGHHEASNYYKHHPGFY